MATLFLVMGCCLWIYMLSSISMSTRPNACWRMNTLPAVLACLLACLRRTFGSATGNARTHMHAHQLHTRSSCSCPVLLTSLSFPHSRGHLNSHQSATAVFHQGHVHPPVSPSDTIGWITRILDTNGYATEDWQSQSDRLMLSRRAMAACIHRCIEHHYTLTPNPMRSRLQV